MALGTLLDAISISSFAPPSTPMFGDNKNHHQQHHHQLFERLKS